MPLRFPLAARQVYAQVGEAGLHPLTRVISYSPFRAELRLDPLAQEGRRWASVMGPESGEVRIVVDRPLQHVRCDFVVRDVQLLETVPLR